MKVQSKICIIGDRKSNSGIEFSNCSEVDQLEAIDNPVNSTGYSQFSSQGMPQDQFFSQGQFGQPASNVVVNAAPMVTAYSQKMHKLIALERSFDLSNSS